MFFVSAEIEIRMSELSQIFCPSLNLEMRVNVAPKKPKKLLVASIVASCQRFQELVFAEPRVSDTEKKARYFSSCSLATKFLDTNCAFGLAL